MLVFVPELPKGCKDCQLNYVETESVNGLNFSTLYCAAMEEDVLCEDCEITNVDRRLPNCPLIQLPQP